MPRIITTVADKQQITDNLFRLKFGLEDGHRVEFMPGQFMSIAVEGAIRRSYSISNPTHENHILETFVDTTPQGPGSRYFDRVEVGEEVDILAPLGKFTYQNTTDAAVHFFAGGVGITPFISMIRHELELVGSKRPVFLHYGVRHEPQLVLHNEFLRWEVEHDNFYYHPFVSRPSEEGDWAGRVGRITQHVDEVQPGDHVYICGGREMINDVESGLLERGIGRDVIFYERFY